MCKKPYRAAELGANSRIHIIQTHLDQFSYQASCLMERRLVPSFKFQPEQSSDVQFELAGTKCLYKHKRLNFQKSFIVCGACFFPQSIF